MQNLILASVKWCRMFCIIITIADTYFRHSNKLNVGNVTIYVQENLFYGVCMHYDNERNCVFSNRVFYTSVFIISRACFIRKGFTALITYVTSYKCTVDISSAAFLVFKVPDIASSHNVFSLEILYLWATWSSCLVTTAFHYRTVYIYWCIVH